MDSVIVLDFDAFQKLVDLIGGVDIYVEKNLKYTDRAGGLFINIKKGNQHLDGYNAMCFVRYRHGDDDFHRQARQQRFLMALKSQVLRHWTQLPEVINLAVGVMGGDLTEQQIVALAFFGKAINDANIKMGVIPVVNADNYNLRLDDSKLPAVLQEYGFTSN